MTVRKALALAVALEVAMLAFAVVMLGDAGASGRRWALAGALVGVATGAWIVWKVSLTIRSGETPPPGRGAQLGPTVGAFLGLAAVVLFGDDVQLGIVWFVAVALGLALAVATWAHARHTPRHTPS